MSRQVSAVVAVGLVGICLALLASANGWLGAAVVCGADGVPGCVAWPAAVSLVVWAGFVAGLVGLVIWQVRYLDR